MPAELGAPLGGYGGIRDRNATSTYDPPQARALLLEGSGKRVAWVSLDIVIARPELRSALLASVADQRLDAVLIAATHTHSGPGGYIEGFLAERITSGAFDPTLRDALVSAAARAIRAAQDDLRPVRVAAAEAELTLATNRRVASGPREVSLPVLSLEPLEDGASPIVVFAYGAHPTVWSPNNHAFSADYVGAARRWLESRGLRALYLAGPMGDQRPTSRLGELGSGDSQLESKQVEEIGAAVGEATYAALESLQSGSSELALVEQELELPEFRLRPLCALWWLAPFVRAPTLRFLSPSVPIQVYALGPVRLLAVPAEPSAALGEKLRAAIAEVFPGSVRFVVAHANDWAGYAVTSESYERGGYEACLSFRGADFDAWLVERGSHAARALAARAPATQRNAAE